MKIGPAIRRALPHGLERKVAQLYRIIFVDLSKVAGRLADALPSGAHILDIGGGDGELLNCLLKLRADIKVTMVDIAPSVGRFLEDEFRNRVRFFPGTPIDMHLREEGAKYDAAIVSDVMHHIPKQHRASFLEDVHRALKPAAKLFVKDIEPGHPIATLSFYSDVFVSGDRGVSLVSMEEVNRLVESAAPGATSKELGLWADHKPNYILEFSLPSSGSLSTD